MKTLILLMILVTYSCFSLIVQAEVPKLINYQGKLTNVEGGCVDTTVSMQFSIYTDSTGGNLLWSEIQSAIRVKEGIFNVLLGSGTEIPDSVFTGDIRYLGVKVEDDAEMNPRKVIVSAPYAYKSIHADTSTHLKVWPPRTKMYDSGWFSAEQSQVYPLAHNLGTTRVIAELWFLPLQMAPALSG